MGQIRESSPFNTDWTSIIDLSSLALKRIESDFPALNPMIKELFNTSYLIINRQTRVSTGYPQEFICVHNAHFSFRSFIGSMLAAFSGYIEPLELHERSQYETRARIIDILKSDMEEKSYGYLLRSTDDTVDAMKRDRADKKLINGWENYRKRLTEDIKSNGYSIDKCQKYSKRSFREIFVETEMEHIYFREYRMLSLVAHGKIYSTHNDASSNSSDGIDFNIGPVVTNRTTDMVFRNLSILVQNYEQMGVVLKDDRIAQSLAIVNSFFGDKP